MKKFEYKVACVYGCDDDSVESELNKMGEQGWELVSLQIDKVYNLDNSTTKSIQAVYKREKNV